MIEIMKIIISTFQESKAAGSYTLFYLLALGLGLAVAWDRYGKSELEDNWMVEEAKKHIQLWPFLYGLTAVILVVMNPLAIWGINKLTPIAGQYYKVWGLLLFLFLCAYGMVCFLSLLREKSQKAFVTIGFVILIGLAGSSYGVMAGRPGKGDTVEEAQVVQWIKEFKEDALVLAVDPVLEYMGIYEPGMQVLYGKDIYTANMDLGIMDSYPLELMHLYEAVKQPQGCMGEISNVAYMYDCDAVVVKYFENAPDKAGVYYKREITDNYILYMR